MFILRGCIHKENRRGNKNITNLIKLISIYIYIFNIFTYMKKKLFFQLNGSVSTNRTQYTLINSPKMSVTKFRFEFCHDVTCH